MERTIRHTFFYPHPPERVWEYLTDSTLLSEWLMPNNFQPIIGHSSAFRGKARPGQDFDGNIFCEVLELIPHRRLSYSWKGGPEPGKITLDSVVTWTLEPKNNGTELALEHSGFRGLKNFFAYFIMNMGWVKIGKRLLKKINISVYGNARS